MNQSLQKTRNVWMRTAWVAASPDGSFASAPSARTSLTGLGPNSRLSIAGGKILLRRRRRPIQQQPELKGDSASEAASDWVGGIGQTHRTCKSDGCCSSEGKDYRSGNVKTEWKAGEERAKKWCVVLCDLLLWRKLETWTPCSGVLLCTPRVSEFPSFQVS